MEHDLVQIRSQAELKEKENYRFRAFLKPQVQAGAGTD